MRRVVLSKTCIQGNSARLAGPLYHHLHHVLRLRVGAEIIMTDETGAEHRGRIAQITAAEMEIAIEETNPPPPELRPRLRLIYGLSRRLRTEWVLQKATELGVDVIVPALCERSVSRPDLQSRKLERWEEILRQAARQSGRALLPRLFFPPLPFETALTQALTADIRLIASPASPPLSSLRHAFSSSPAEVALAVGPEGGFSDGEMESAERSGFTPVSLGPLVLRTETAAIALLALASYLTGRMD